MIDVKVCYTIQALRGMEAQTCTVLLLNSPYHYHQKQDEASGEWLVGGGGWGVGWDAEYKVSQSVIEKDPVPVKG